jgi:nucleolar protein 4
MEDLRATFLPYGPVHSVDLPTAPSKLPPGKDGTPHPPRLRGFAFVWFLTRKDAEKAMEAVNGKTLSRAGNRKSKAKGEERVVAVDWALSKDKWLEAQKGEAGEEGQAKEKGEEEGEEEDDDEDEEDESDEESEDGSEADVDMEGSESDDEEEEAEDGNDDNDDEAEEQDEPVKPKLPTVDVGSTLFVRNLSFEAEEQELGEL